MVSLCLKEPRFLRKWDRETQKRSGGRKRTGKVIREQTGREGRGGKRKSRGVFLFSSVKLLLSGQP